ncbi:MAG: hypothetical protein COA79_15905 [Planctomycetota bacterium]|nr:MAG: hypothetical protein COA79_15905 [Planctomycetota bacterium]
MKRINSFEVTDNIRIYQRKEKGKWYCSYKVDGKKVDKSLKTSHYGRAIELAKELSKNPIDSLIDEGNLNLPQTISEATSDYLDHLRSERRSEATLRRYTNIFNKFESFCTSQRVRSCQQLNQRVLQSYRKFRADNICEGTRFFETSRIF